MARIFERVWVVGLGTVGAQVAVLLAAGGYRVVGVDEDVAAGWSRVRALVGDRTDLLNPPNPGEQGATGWIDFGRDLGLVRQADLVIEALPEQLDLKVEMLRKADQLCPPETVFVTTTMGLTVTGIAAQCGRMPRTVGMQLCDAAGGLSGEVIELIRTPVTSDDVLESLQEFGAGLGRRVVVGTDQPGSTGTALTLRYLNRAAAMVEEGYATRDDIDSAMTLGCGLPVGPLAQLDRMGVDAATDSLAALAERTGDPSWEPAPILTRMRAAGLLGRKTGRGFHTYDASDEQPSPGESAGTGRVVRRVGVVGAGTMAAGITEVFAANGYDTFLAARNDLRAKQARAAIESSLDRRVRRGKLPATAVATTMDRITAESELDALAECDLVVEAVVEDIDVKRDVFARLDRLVRPGAILATATSSLSVLACATATSRPHDVIGLHFLNPAPVMKLVEVVQTVLTAGDVVATARELVADLGKRTVLCGDRAGFIVNALLLPYLNDAAATAKTRHLAITDVDAVMTGRHGYPMGPFRLLDMIGLDVAVSIVESLNAASGGAAPADYLTELVRAGYLGRKTGRGFYGHDVAQEA